MGVHPDNKIPFGIPYPYIQSKRGEFSGIINHPDERMFQRILGNNFPGPVRRHAVKHQNLKAFLGIVLFKQGLKAFGNVFLFVPAGNDYGNKRHVIG
jgi:hypothetical protein